MAGTAKLILVGNLGRDPEMRYTPNGDPVTSFSVAVSRPVRASEGQGQGQEETDWYNVSCWGRQAEIANQYLAKGRQVYIEGRLRPRMYDDRNGERRVSLDVRATELVLLGQRGDAAETGAGQSSDATDLDSMPF